MLRLDPALALGSLRWLLGSVLLLRASGSLAPFLFPGATDWRDRTLRRLVTAAALAASSVAILGFLGVLTPRALLLLTVALWGATRLVPPPRRDDARDRPVRTFGGSTWIPVGLVLAIEGWLVLPLPPANWDAMTFHLYHPARWLQEGRLFHVPAVFADPAGAYAPQNGALVYAWLMGLAGHDALCNVVQLLAAGTLALAAAEIASTLGIGSRSAALTGLIVVLLPPVRRWAATANVDVLMNAAWLAAVAWGIATWSRLPRSPEDRRGTLAVGALAAGFAAGTKTLGLPLALGPLLLLAAGRLRRGGSTRRLASDLAMAGAAFLAGGGWWILRNLLVYDNPLFPLDWAIGPLRFPGVFRREALDRSIFHVSFGEWADQLPVTLGWAACSVVLLGWIGGLLALLDAVRRRGEPARSALTGLVAGIFPAAWVWFHVTQIPYNNQDRFLLPALLTAALGLPRLLGLPGPKWRDPALAITAVGLWLAPPASSIGGRRWLPLLLEANPGSLAVIGALLALLGGSALLVSRVRSRWARGLVILCGALAGWIAVSGAAATSEELRPAVLAAEDYGRLAPGFLPFHLRTEELPDGPPALDVAYSGVNLPYALMGPGQRHRVLYVTTRGRRGDGLWEHWTRDPRLHDTHRPGLYRGRDDDPRTWLRYLTEEGIDVVFVHRIFQVPGEVPEHWSLSDGFPAERRWIRSMPDVFTPWFATDLAEAYWFRPPGRDPAPFSPSDERSRPTRRRSTPR